MGPVAKHLSQQQRDMLNTRELIKLEVENARLKAAD